MAGGPIGQRVWGFTWQTRVTEGTLKSINDSIDPNKTEVEGPKSFAAYRAAWKKGTRQAALGRYDKDAEEVSYSQWRDDNSRTGDHRFCWACGSQDHPTATWFKNCGATMSWEDLKLKYAQTWGEQRTFKPTVRGGRKGAGS